MKLRCWLVLALACGPGTGPLVAEPISPPEPSEPPSDPAPSPDPVVQPAQSSERESPPAETSPELILEAEGLSVRLTSERLEVRWGGATKTLRVRPWPGSLVRARRVSLADGVEGLFVEGFGTVHLLARRSDELQWVRQASIASFASHGGDVPGDGTVRMREVAHEACSPTRADVVRVARETGAEEVVLRRHRWLRTRVRERILRLTEDDELVWAVPRWRWVGEWTDCTTKPFALALPAATPEPLGADARELLSRDGVAVRQDSEGRIQVVWGGQERTLDMRGLDGNGSVDRAEAEVVRLPERALFVTLTWTYEDDGYADATFLLVPRSGSLEAMTTVPGIDPRGLRGARFPGDGTIVVPHRASRECLPTPAEVRAARALHYGDERGLTEVESGLDFWRQRRSGERLLRVRDGVIDFARRRWRWRGAWGRCEGEIFAACPFVDVVGPEGTERIGEILRSVEYADAVQTLELPVERELLTVRISEEKDEVTLLDHLALEIDGRVLGPERCGDGPLCERDGRYEILERGDSIEVSFDVGASRGSARLIASGYYEPR